MTDEESLTDMVWANAERFGATIGFRRRLGGSWVDVTTREFATQVLELAKGLIAAGLRPGDRIALLSGPRYEWSLFEFACWSVGCVTVPIAATATPAEAEWILSDSGACGVVVETPEHRETVRRVVDRLPEIVWVWQLDGGVAGSGDLAEDVPAAVPELTALGTQIYDDRAHERRLSVRTEDIATVAYPDGDHPKRSELTHGDLLAAVRATIGAHPALLRSGNSLLVLLAPADLPTRVVTLACVYTRTTLGLVPDADDLFTDLGVFRPRVIVADAELLGRFHDAARSKAYAEGNMAVFDTAESVAVSYGAAGDRAPLALRLKHVVASKVVYPKLRASFGGRCVAAFTSGEPLDISRVNFYRGIGIEVHELTAPV
ncbi:AMP-binding protein [Actinophytocola oryzae]|uniref:AMP-binding protein n=1 Tax=Actinophytocola oryzae TaxID=502181 RepID=UPI001414CDBA|nr:AMP-binding protein [Actinophytocola oryzae]